METSPDFIPIPIELNDSLSERIETNGKSKAPPALVTSFPAPWKRKNTELDNYIPPFIRLHNEILDFCEYITPSPEEMLKREAVLNEITAVIKEMWPDCEVKLFGSQLTKIVTPMSDLDVVVLAVPTEDEDDITEELVSLTEKFKASGIVSYAEAIINAKVPIVKLDHKASGLAVDIAINNDSGLRTGAMIIHALQLFPQLRPLTTVLKIALAQRRLNDTYNGGMGSFLLSMTVLSFLQMKQRVALFRGIQLSWNLGALLLDYCQLYGSDLNYFAVGVSVRNGGEYFNKRKRKIGIEANQNRGNHLCMENPDMPEIDLSRNMFILPKIRRSLEQSVQVLTCALQNRQMESYLCFVVHPNDPALINRPQLHHQQDYKLPHQNQQQEQTTTNNLQQQQEQRERATASTAPPPAADTRGRPRHTGLEGSGIGSKRGRQ